jgi:hypothetical protein
MTKCLLKARSPSRGSGQAPGGAAALGCAVLGAILVLGLLLGACENPANGDNGPTAQELAAEEFRADYREILEKALVRVTLSDGAVIDEALATYEVLGDDVKALLAAEKEKLDSLKARMNTRRASVTALYAYLEGLPENTKYNPYYVAYTGNETSTTVYNALALAGKYVSLDLSQSGVEGFGYDVEPGRKLVVDLVLPDSLEKINDSLSITPVFGSFTNLKTVQSAGLLQLGAYAFADCTNLEDVTLDEATEIGLLAFVGSGLKTVSLPKTTTTDNGVFRDCTSLTTVNLPNAVSIGNFAFSNCASLITINLPKVTSLGINMFQSCTSLTTVTLPEVTSIGSDTFSQCTSLTTVTLPEVTSIGSIAFFQCTSLTTVTLGETPPTIATLARIFTDAAMEPKTITIKVPAVTAYTAAGTPWTDKVGPNSGAGYFWDNNTATRDNLTVALEAIGG